MRNVSAKLCTENQNTPFRINNIFENHAVCETMWKIVVEQSNHGWQHGGCVLQAG
jgi:hypothetical protein